MEGRRSVTFIWDFVASVVLNQIVDWIYQTVVGFLGDFFSMMGQMGAELFDLPWVDGVVQFFTNFGWALFTVGLVVAVFEFAIESQTGRGDFKTVCIHVLKGFFAVSLFGSVPVELYQFAVTLQGQFTKELSGVHLSDGIGGMAEEILQALDHSNIASNPIVGLFIVIMMAYAVFKVFFGNLKRGGILLIQIAVGSLYMFSVPRGFVDGFLGWCKQVIGLCLTAFLQATILIVGLLVMNDHPLMGLGVLLSATEIPRICQQFGLETSTHANIMSAVYTTQSVVNLTRNVVSAIK